MQKIEGVYKKYLSIIFDPAYYINRSHLKLSKELLHNPIVRSEINSLIIDEYNLDCSIDNLNGVAIMFITNWQLLPVVAYYIGVENINGVSLSNKNVTLDFINNVNSEVINDGYHQLIAWGNYMPQGLSERINLLFNKIVLKDNDKRVERNILQLSKGIQYARKHFTCFNRQCL